VYVDLMTNEANYAFGGLPERLAIISNNKTVYIGGIGPYGFDIDEMEQALKKVLSRAA